MYQNAKINSNYSHKYIQLNIMIPRMVRKYLELNKIYVNIYGISIFIIANIYPIWVGDSIYNFK